MCLLLQEGTWISTKGKINDEHIHTEHISPHSRIPSTLGPCEQQQAVEKNQGDWHVSETTFTNCQNQSAASKDSCWELSPL